MSNREEERNIFQQYEKILEIWTVLESTNIIGIYTEVGQHHSVSVVMKLSTELTMHYEPLK